MAGVEQERVAEAMRALPDPWRTALWHAEVLGRPPREIAVLLGIQPNAVSAPLIRARTGLRKAWRELEAEASKGPARP